MKTPLEELYKACGKSWAFPASKHGNFLNVIAERHGKLMPAHGVENQSSFWWLKHAVTHRVGSSRKT
jgi:hypothetical protein